MSTSATQSRKDQILADIDADLEKLRAPHEEYLELEALRNTIAGTANHNGRGRTPRASAASGATGTTGRGRRRGINRSEEFMNIVRENPGITLPDAAKIMGIEPNYLYRVRPNLEKAGKLRREGQQIFVVT